jgi:peptidoglycan/LPS O-acetylase OafA/YrhL
VGIGTVSAVRGNLRQRTPSLDGLRAASICVVLLGHLCGTAGFPLNAHTQFVAPLARYGVTVFFVISGFLITGLLLAEHQATGRISLRDFYIRRILRIVPAFALFLISMALAHAAGLVSLTTTDLLTALTWTVNFNPNRSWVIGHLWSLSVEEQFYLLWPATVVLLGFARSRWVAITAVLAGPVVRVGMRVAFHHSALRDLEIFPAVADSIAIGCVVALHRGQLVTSHWWQVLSSQRMIVPVFVMVGILAAYDGYTPIPILGGPLTLIATAALVEGSTRASGTVLGRLLNSKPVEWVGMLSYSLYLWQQPFLNRAVRSTFTSFPLNICAALLCAILSFYLLERPFLRLRRRFRVTPTTTSDSGTYPSASCELASASETSGRV